MQLFCSHMNIFFVDFLVFCDGNSGLESISGPAMIVGEHKFHPECFRCTDCQQFIGDGDLYALVERSKLFWLVYFIILV